MSSSPRARRAAALAERDRRSVESIGLRAVLPVARTLRALASRVHTQRLHGHELQAHIDDAMKPLASILRDAMVVAHLRGRQRAVITSAHGMAARRKAAGAYDEAMKWRAARMNLSDAEIAHLKDLYGREAVEVTRVAAGSLEAKARGAVYESLQEGLHVKGGIAAMRNAFDAAGVTVERPFLLETLVRTQTQLAYGAGQWNADQDPAIQEILWGYEYVTVGDDRVRENHAEMDGMKAAKDHDCWTVCWPPCGFNCRCSILECYEEDDEAVPENYADLPDPGWGFNPGMVYRDMINPAPPTPAMPFGFDPNEPRDERGRWTDGDGPSPLRGRWPSLLSGNQSLGSLHPYTFVQSYK